MGLPPPKLRDLLSVIGTTDCMKEQNVWEISVPSRNSLHWSIILAYLFAGDDERLYKFVGELKSKKPSKKKRIKNEQSFVNALDYEEVKKKLFSFNPFKSRLFFRFPELVEAFKAQLATFDNKAKIINDGCKDKTILNSAAIMLDCKIYIYFPEEKNTKFMAFPKQPTKRNTPTIILFQYKNETIDSEPRQPNYHFGMTLERAFQLKLQALTFILQKTQLTPKAIQSVQRIMEDAQAHGENFISTILNSRCSYLLPMLYHSAYIALKLSEAGFETDPAVIRKGKPSALLYAAATGGHYLRILYDYCANSRYRFEKTIRNPDSTVLENLKVIQGIFNSDRDALNDCDYDRRFKKLIHRVIRGFSGYNEFQQSVATFIIKLKSELQSDSRDLVHIRKKFIQEILGSYNDCFYFDLPKSDMLEKYHNYLQFIEYYTTIDDFACLCFFDSVYLLKKIYQLEKSNIFARTESAFFLLTVSYEYFPLVDVEFRSFNSQKNCDVEENYLQIIPLFYRESLKSEINSLLTMLSEHDISQNSREKIKETLNKCLSPFPEIKDELVIHRIRQYLNAAINVSFRTDKSVGILVIERALQVLGESLKPQTKNCVVSCLLASRLPQNLNEQFIHIRNNLSYYKANSVHGRLDIEKDERYFQNIQRELKYVSVSFEVVALTQYLRLEKYLMRQSQNKISELELDHNTRTNFLSVCQMRLSSRKKNYQPYKKDLIKLSIDVVYYLKNLVFSMVKRFPPDDQNICNISEHNEFNIRNTLYSTVYLFKFMCEEIDVKYFKPLLRDIKRYFHEYKTSGDCLTLLMKTAIFYSKLRNSAKSVKVYIPPCFSCPYILSFLERIGVNSILPDDITDILATARNCYKEANDERLHQINHIETNTICEKNIQESLMRLIINGEQLIKLQIYLSNNQKLALKQLNKNTISLENLEEKIEQMLQMSSKQVKEVNNKNNSDNEIFKIFLVKIVYQKYLKSSIFSFTLREDLREKLQMFLTSKVTFLLSRIKLMKSILIDEDEEIRQIWEYGQSKGMKCRIKFLMRQRFLQEMTVRASLEMVFFDCLNILKQQKFIDIYEKANNLFTGINVRNVLSHGHNVLETIGGLLDEDDLPSEMINKMLEIIEDYDAIVSLLDLIPHSNTLEKNSFEDWIESSTDNSFEKQIQKVNKCPRWRDYLILLPLI